MHALSSLTEQPLTCRARCFARHFTSVLQTCHGWRIQDHSKDCFGALPSSSACSTDIFGCSWKALLLISTHCASRACFTYLFGSCCRALLRIPKHGASSDGATHLLESCCRPFMLTFKHCACLLQLPSPAGQLLPGMALLLSFEHC